MAAGLEASHGIGPVWSPDGEAIVYQRLCKTNPENPSLPCREQHEVVSVTPGDPSEGATSPREVVIPAFQLTADGSGRYLFPFRVTWSPDGQYLLYQAWGEAPSSVSLVAVPTEPGMPSIILAKDDNIVPYEGYPDTSFVGIQAWGRRPSD